MFALYSRLNIENVLCLKLNSSARKICQSVKFTQDLCVMCKVVVWSKLNPLGAHENRPLHPDFSYILFASSGYPQCQTTGSGLAMLGDLPWCNGLNGGFFVMELFRYFRPKHWKKNSQRVVTSIMTNFLLCVGTELGRAVTVTRKKAPKNHHQSTNQPINQKKQTKPKPNQYKNPGFWNFRNIWFHSPFQKCWDIRIDFFFLSLRCEAFSV